jgi:hypothetical protein
MAAHPYRTKTLKTAVSGSAGYRNSNTQVPSSRP